ncbi:MAG: hypothetical protein NC127_08460 [Muribaculum sp.]|nr:hypothetical protein [Muribaculum sp.]
MIKSLSLAAFLLLNAVTLFAEDETDNHLIDLGLPSGTLWLDHNLGATNSYDFGEYYVGTEDNSLQSTLGANFFIPSKNQIQELIEVI